MKDIKKTSKEWYKKEAQGLIILDPDGWDRKNLDYSFNEELITKEEFKKRLCLSTIGYLSFPEDGIKLPVLPANPHAIVRPYLKAITKKRKHRKFCHYLVTITHRIKQKVKNLI